MVPSASPDHVLLVSLAKNYIGRAGAFSLAKLLRASPSLRYLEYVHRRLAARPCHMGGLTDIHCSVSDNQIDVVGTGALVAMLTRNRHLQHLEYVQRPACFQDAVAVRVTSHA